MATGRGKRVTAAELREILAKDLPRAIEERAGRIYLDALTELHETVVRATPRDTGYLRASFLASAGDDAPSRSALPPRAKTKQPAGSYDALAEQSAAACMDAFARAAAALRPVRMAFLADYAVYVEDHAHMVKTARLRWPSIVRRAVKDALR